MLPTQLSQLSLSFFRAAAASVLTFLRRHQILAKVAAKIASPARKIKRTKTCGTRGEELIEATTELTFDLQKHSARISFSRHSIRRSGHPRSQSKGITPEQSPLRENPPLKSKQRTSGPEGNGVLH
jgi:hypothetical protein